MVMALVRYEALTVPQAENTLAMLGEDAVESLLGLELAAVTWHSMPGDLWPTTTPGVDIVSLLERVTDRLGTWQSVCDRIISPHQRPYCDTPEDLYQPVPEGLLSHSMLTALARLMQGASIRQLAQAIKQDEVKLAQLLYPYIQHRVIKLWPPVQPLDRLPWLPAAKQRQSTLAPTANVSASATTSRLVTNSSQLGSGTPSTSSYDSGANGSSAPRSPERVHISDSSILGRRPSTEAQSRYLIICIDDSQAMLDQIDSYLDPERFVLKTVIDPVASVSKICAMKPDLVLMDVSMPSINGNSFCQILKRSYMFKDVPIIMISSNASPLSKATAESSGATDYLEKPFSKAQLMQVLETYLEIERSI
ncbi:response regulator [Leptothoe sp. PORK10 BA2]|uniref:response regulator n=1 Tax=Leptothoe sp. PORK10 BA2 TaxID=3110254 RepID=UPI002B2186C3|nr:response regulator [Leptothoe sp. PORK10 BA2]MEA5466301.1 response regulator [Leptothoe sp. PORK10 BA2]